MEEEKKVETEVVEKKKKKIDTKTLIKEMTFSALLAVVFPVITNAFIVGGELYLYGSPFWFNVGWIALGEFVVMIVGYILFFILKRYKSFFKAINATQNTEYKF